MPQKEAPDAMKNGKGKGGKHGKKHVSKRKIENPPNLWAYKDKLPVPNEKDKCSLTNLSMLSCRATFEIKPLSAGYTEKSQDDDLYYIFGGLINKGVGFMRQWIR